jgi:hypothetical protein
VNGLALRLAGESRRAFTGSRTSGNWVNTILTLGTVGDVTWNKSFQTALLSVWCALF